MHIFWVPALSYGLINKPIDADDIRMYRNYKFTELFMFSSKSTQSEYQRLYKTSFSSL